MVATRYKLALLLLLAPTVARESTGQRNDVPKLPLRPNVPFHLTGLLSPATVANSIFLCAQPDASALSVTWFLDDRPIATATQPPFWLGSQTQGFSLEAVSPGPHRLRATATLANNRAAASEIITLDVVPSIAQQFSPSLTPYANQPTAQQKPLFQVLAETSTPGAILTPAEQATRLAVLSMYLNWGIDPSLDSSNDQSPLLLALAPTTWADAPQADAPLSLLFSPDAPFYQPIPAHWPRTPLPPGYFETLQLNTNQGGDGIGFGESISSLTDPVLMVTSQWYADAGTRKTFPFSIGPAWFKSLPDQTEGDMHMVFVDPATRAFVTTYKTSLSPETRGPDALYASSPTPLNTLGDHGGSIAAGFAELPLLLQPGEATDSANPIRHALGGSVARTWAARVYPATSWDGGVKTSINSCTHTGFTNTGLVPYGAVVQLDPAVDLASLHLTLPALRILQAIQTYGFYVMDFGCTDLDIYTAIPETELDPFGGLWGYNRRGPGVQNEVRAVLMNNRLSVVAPLAKKQ